PVMREVDTCYEARAAAAAAKVAREARRNSEGAPFDSKAAVRELRVGVDPDSGRSQRQSARREGGGRID
ncbi:MAG: hypothetical protein SGPRY_011699, partial [Prymnesium sp.]